MSTRFLSIARRLISLVTSQQDYPGKPGCLRKALMTPFWGACVILFPRYDMLTAALL